MSVQVHSNINTINDHYLNTGITQIEMSGPRIKSKTIPFVHNPEQGQEQTQHSTGLVGCSSSARQQNEQPIFYSQVHSPSLQTQQQGNSIAKNSCITSCGKITNQVNWTYTNPIEDGHGSHLQASAEFNSEKQANGLVSTPPAKGKLAGKKLIRKLGEVSTVESKFMMSRTPHESILESEVVMRDWKNVGKIMPIKLVYQQQLAGEKGAKNQPNEWAVDFAY